MASVPGYGGLGSMEVLPREIRQMIYGYAFGSGMDSPVTVKRCCTPDTKDQVRSACPKHGISAAIGACRFNILEVSKAMNEEALWIVYRKTPLLLNMDHTIVPYLYNYVALRTPRHHLLFAQNKRRKLYFWTTASRFHTVLLRVPESSVKYGVPERFTDHLLRTTVMLCNSWDQVPSQPGILRFFHIRLGSMFKEMLPFNMESQASDRYEELLDWIAMWSPREEPDFDEAALQCAYKLQRIVSIVGSYKGQYQCTIAAESKLEEKDEGGLQALRELEAGCEMNGIRFIHC